jgi:catechol-2,3-dioxygenase
VRILEVVLPSPAPGELREFHAAFASSTTLRFRAGPRVCSHWALNVPTDRFEEAVAFAAQRVELLHEDVPFAAWRARSAYFYDPAGNIVELIARERAPGSDLFLEVSEVGLPVADVAVAVEFFEARLGLPHFSGDRREFSAIGDDRGLFIVVPVGRAWLFTDQPAPDHPIELTVAAQQDAEVCVPGSGHTLRLASGHDG